MGMGRAGELPTWFQGWVNPFWWCRGGDVTGMDPDEADFIGERDLVLDRLELRVVRASSGASICASEEEGGAVVRESSCGLCLLPQLAA